MKPETIQRNADTLFQALVALGPGWHTRREIAAYLKTKRVSGHAAVSLDLLIQDGRIEVERQDVIPPKGVEKRWIYRVKDGNAQRLTGTAAEVDKP